MRKIIILAGIALLGASFSIGAVQLDVSLGAGKVVTVNAKENTAAPATELQKSKGGIFRKFTLTEEQVKQIHAEHAKNVDLSKDLPASHQKLRVIPVATGAEKVAQDSAYNCSVKRLGQAFELDCVGAK